MAEFGWLMYHMTLASALPGIGAIKLTHGALIALALSFLAERVYASYERHGEVRNGDVLLPILFSVSVILVIIGYSIVMVSRGGI